ncbi:hypothetical protein AHF37_00355 [Paragonimus kellicotti]|nr:hypothetical protein AHF37_00355 [Paragonimus kellicotti]
MLLEISPPVVSYGTERQNIRNTVNKAAHTTSVDHEQQTRSNRLLHTHTHTLESGMTGVRVGQHSIHTLIKRHNDDHQTASTNPIQSNPIQSNPIQSQSPSPVRPINQVLENSSLRLVSHSDAQANYRPSRGTTATKSTGSMNR